MAIFNSYVSHYQRVSFFSNRGNLDRLVRAIRMAQQTHLRTQVEIMRRGTAIGPQITERQFIHVV